MNEEGFFYLNKMAPVAFELALGPHNDNIIHTDHIFNHFLSTGDLKTDLFVNIQIF